MKTGNQNNGNNRKGTTSANRPEIRDNLDSRKNEEQDFKGDDMTHNKKEHRSQKHEQGRKS